MKIRKGVLVKYIGQDELAQGMVFKVHQKWYQFITVNFPVRYLNGEVHRQLINKPLEDFEIYDRKE